MIEMLCIHKKDIMAFTSLSKRYINGTLWGETGLSSNPDDLVLSGDSLNQLRLGYEVDKIRG
jgi:hypothetical protein